MSTPDDALVELVARAEWVADNGEDDPWESHDEALREDYRQSARAVLSALRDAGALPDKEVAEQLIRALAHNHWQATEIGRLRDERDQARDEAGRYVRHLTVALNGQPSRAAVVALDVLRELVALKDGPRDADYERRKPLAWEAARRALDGEGPDA